jgi:hypothetical protein
MPHSTVVERPTEEPAERLAARRRARYGSRLARHILLWCAAGRTPTDMAAVLCCARSRVYRPGRADREGSRAWASDDAGPLVPPVRRPMVRATRRRSVVTRLQAPPRAYGGCRTRWSGATLALTWPAPRGLTVAADTLRRWIPAGDGVWTRPTRIATDDAPRRVERWARLRVTVAPRKRSAAMVCADARALQLWPTVG